MAIRHRPRNKRLSASRPEWPQAPPGLVVADGPQAFDAAGHRFLSAFFEAISFRDIPDMRVDDRNHGSAFEFRCHLAFVPRVRVRILRVPVRRLPWLIDCTILDLVLIPADELW